MQLLTTGEFLTLDDYQKILKVAHESEYYQVLFAVEGIEYNGGKRRHMPKKIAIVNGGIKGIRT